MRDRHHDACSKPVMLLPAPDAICVIRNMHDKAPMSSGSTGASVISASSCRGGVEVDTPRGSENNTGSAVGAGGGGGSSTGTTSARAMKRERSKEPVGGATSGVQQVKTLDTIMSAGADSVEQLQMIQAMDVAMAEYAKQGDGDLDNFRDQMDDGAGAEKERAQYQQLQQGRSASPTLASQQLQTQIQTGPTSSQVEHFSAVQRDPRFFTADVADFQGSGNTGPQNHISWESDVTEDIDKLAPEGYLPFARASASGAAGSHNTFDHQLATEQQLRELMLARRGSAAEIEAQIRALQAGAVSGSFVPEGAAIMGPSGSQDPADPTSSAPEQVVASGMLFQDDEDHHGAERVLPTTGTIDEHALLRQRYLAEQRQYEQQIDLVQEQQQQLQVQQTQQYTPPAGPPRPQSASNVAATRKKMSPWYHPGQASVFAPQPELQAGSAQQQLYPGTDPGPSMGSAAQHQDQMFAAANPQAQHVGVAGAPYNINPMNNAVLVHQHTTISPHLLPAHQAFHLQQHSQPPFLPPQHSQPWPTHVFPAPGQHQHAQLPFNPNAPQPQQNLYQHGVLVDHHLPAPEHASPPEVPYTSLPPLEAIREQNWTQESLPSMVGEAGAMQSQVSCSVSSVAPAGGQNSGLSP
ncbi:unnamed protein product, partial [Amoebophrya sp. A120]|eukprot:GSA120T00015779001.1